MNNIKFPEPYRYCERYVEDFIKNCNIEKMRMRGAVDTLKEVKAAIDSVYTRAQYLDYDVGFFGWDGKDLDDMREIREMITQRLLEVWVLCSIGLGEDKEWYQNG